MKRLLLIAALLFGAPALATELSPLLSTQNADNVTLYPGLLTYPAGPFHPMGLLYTITATSGTGTGTGAQTLGTYSLPANALDAPGRKLRITAAFTTAANTHSKTCTLNFGTGPEQVSTGAMSTSSETAELSLVVTKTGSSTQTVTGSGVVATTPIATYYAAGAETDTGALTISAICTDGTSAANDAVLADFFVEYMN
jgi:hypothetical protein